jgi:hypothetical protein
MIHLLVLYPVFKGFERLFLLKEISRFWHIVLIQDFKKYIHLAIYTKCSMHF